MQVADVFARLGTRPQGLTSQEGARRLEEHGPNVLARDRPPGLARLIQHALLNPLVILFGVLAAVSFATGDARAGVMMLLMIFLSVGLTLIQESRASGAAAKLRAMISVAATVLRDEAPREIPIAQLVPGDVVHLTAGDMIPGDVRIVEAKDLFVSQGSLTGESLPVEKHAALPQQPKDEAKDQPKDETKDEAKPKNVQGPTELTNIAFLGTSVESGSASAVVVATGNDTYLGGVAASLSEQPSATAFDRGISRFTWLMLRFMFW